MAARLSDPIEALIDDQPPGDRPVAWVDVAIVGSGYGASVAAACLAGTDRKVVVLERGREYAPGEFPVGLGEVPGHVRFHRADGDEPIGYPDALFDIRIGKDMDVLVGSGLGGTSLINANVAVQPDDDDFRNPAWPQPIRSNPATLHDGFEKARTLLRVHTPAVDKIRKFKALSTLAGALGADCEAAPVTVNFDGPGANPAQPACTRCGNCVTGCNVGAKNTLAMTALPEAKARGARLYTGAVVLSLMWDKDAPYPWIIRFRRTASEKTPLQDEVYRLAARDVILAAGTLGSTEILMRSRELHGLAVSSLLGKRFSGNGDALAFGFAGERRVHAVGERVQRGKHDVGPTISGIVRAVVNNGRRKPQKLTIEDAAVPTSIRRLFAELMATGAFLHRLDRASLPAWYRQHEDVDPIAVPDDAIEHSQILLTMGDDGAGGTLKLRRPSDKSEDHAHLVVDWPSVGRNPALRAADRLFQQHDRGPGLNGGQYVPNPLWRALPEGASSVMSGPALGGRAVTVHPLGGCGMGDDIDSGVVNHLGQVFRPDPEGDGTEVYDGLHVLDGAIVPKALGLNPLLTIAALSWRAAEALRASRGWARGQRTSLPMRQRAVARRAAEPDRIDVVWREQLVGRVHSLPAWLEAVDPTKTRRWLQDKGVIVRIEMRVADLEGWLAKATDTPLRGTAELHCNPLPADLSRRLHRIHTPAEELGPHTLVAKGHGELLLFKRDEVGVLRRCWRTALALWTYAWRRQPFRGKEREPKALPRSTGDRSSRIGLVEEAWKFVRLGWEQARYRRLQYRLRFGQGDDAFALDGEKVLAWSVVAPRLFDALLNLPFTLSRVSRPGARVTGELEVDMTNFVTTAGTPQVTSSPHLPATVVGLSRFGMLFARAVLATHLWEFGGPNYPVHPIPRPAGPLALEVGKKKPRRPERIPLWVPLHENGDAIRLWLTRYRQDGAGAEPVLLIHGLAQGSLIYTTNSLDTNMAAAMWRAGYDVWLLDYRLSNMLPDRVPQGDWSMDEIARYDVPAAVRHVYTATGDQRVRIFAHCVGATSVAMAILKGWLRDPATGRPCVESVAFNAIHPWTIPSAVNEFRARLGSFFRNVMGEDLLDPVPTVHPTAAQALLDRLAFSVARYAEEGGDHRRSRRTEQAATVCDRMTFLYGRMWRHMNLDPRTHAQFPMLMGPGAGDVYRQLYYFALSERLTDHEGSNAYLTADNIRRHWADIPTFFLHGEESMVFNPESAERSAIRLDMLLNHHTLDNETRPARPTPVRLLRVPEFGHMDVVFGKDANEKVYEPLRKFFANPTEPVGDQVDPERDISAHSGFRLTAGPVLRAAWVDDDKRVRFRLWAETNDEVTSLVDGVQLDATDVVERRQWTLEGCEPRYRMLDARLDGRSATFGLAVKLGGSGKTPPKLPGQRLSYDTLPWLERLRRHDRSRPAQDMRFLVGSCRYPGTPFESAASDAIFAGMLPHIEGRKTRWPGVHMLFLVGDQIYADATANIVDSRAWRERYAQKYRVAFTSPHARTVLAHVPTHFAIDDHEIADNWSGETTQTTEVEQAKGTAKAFQSSERGGKHPIDPAHKRPSSALWYSLSEQREHCCPGFVMDTRSEREPRLATRGPNAQMLSAEQRDALMNWLASVNEGPSAHMPKFIFCGVGIAPISREFAACGSTWRSQDWWPGYPQALSEVFGFIHRRQIRHVVFVSGDLHLSSVSRLRLRDRGAGDVIVWQIVSSGLYAPMPFANTRPDSYDWNRPVALPSNAHVDIDVLAESGLLCSGRSHFLRVDAEQKGREWTLSVGAVGADGRFVHPGGHPPPGFSAAGRRWVARLGNGVAPTRYGRAMDR